LASAEQQQPFRPQQGRLRRPDSEAQELEQPQEPQQQALPLMQKERQASQEQPGPLEALPRVLWRSAAERRQAGLPRPTELPKQPRPGAWRPPDQPEGVKQSRESEGARSAIRDVASRTAERQPQQARDEAAARCGGAPASQQPPEERRRRPLLGAVRPLEVPAQRSLPGAPEALP
jgi:hypothetical protein